MVVLSSLNTTNSSLTKIETTINFTKYYSTLFNQETTPRVYFSDKQVPECCAHFPQLFVQEKKEKLKLELKLGKDLKRIAQKYFM